MKKMFGAILVGISALALSSCSSDEIHPYTRDVSSGTRTGFFTSIGFPDANENDSVLGDAAAVVEGNGDMYNAVSSDKYGIGYVSYELSQEKGVNALKYNGIEANPTTINNGDYTLVRNFNYMKRDDLGSAPGTVGEAADAFIDFMGSDDAILPLIASGVFADTSGTFNSDDYLVCSASEGSVELKLVGSTSVQKSIEAIAPVFESSCPGVDVTWNFTGSSDGYKYTNGNKKDDPSGGHIGFASREWKESEVADTKGVLAKDAIVVVVHKSNDKVDNLTSQQLRNIYDGTFSVWSDIT